MSRRRTVKRGQVHGHQALWLEDEHLRVCVLPLKGADIYSILHLPTRVEFLMHTPAGLQPPRDAPQADFLDNYEGAWQELFPNHNDASQVAGRRIPFHGEVALQPWRAVIEDEDGPEPVVNLGVDCLVTPFHLDRRMRLLSGQAALELQSTVVNLSPESQRFVWGQHIVLGGGFLEEGCRLDIPAARLTTPDELFEPETARLAPGQDEPWPFARGRKPDERIDLRLIPGPQVHSHDDCCLTGMSEGRWTVFNPRLRLGLQMEWDVGVFPWVQMWQPYGGSDQPPLTGIYGLGLEPWVSRYPLEQAIAHGQALELEGGGRLATTVRVRVLETG